MEHRVRIKGYTERRCDTILSYFEDIGGDIIEDKSNLTERETFLYFKSSTGAARILQQSKHTVTARGGSFVINVYPFSKDSHYQDEEVCRQTAVKRLDSPDVAVEDLIREGQEEAFTAIHHEKTASPPSEKRRFLLTGRGEPPPYSTIDTYMDPPPSQQMPAAYEPPIAKRVRQEGPKKMTPIASPTRQPEELNESRERQPELLDLKMYSVILKDVDPEHDLETLIMYFKNKRSKGGKLDESRCSYDEEEREAVITFTEAGVAERVLSKKDHKVNGMDLNVYPGKREAPMVPDRRGIIIHNTSQFDDDNELTMFIKNKWRKAYPGVKSLEYDVKFNSDRSAVMVTFSQAVADLELLIEKISSQYKDTVLKAEPLYKTHTVLMENIPAKTHKDFIELLIEDSDCFCYDIELNADENFAVVHLKAFEYVDRLCRLARQKRLTIKDEPLKCAPYVPQFQSRTIQPLSERLGITVEIDIYIFACLNQVPSYNEELMAKLEEALACVKWRPSGEIAEGNVSYKPMEGKKLQQDKWEQKVLEVLEVFCAEFTNDCVECSVEVFENVEEEINDKVGLVPTKQEGDKMMIKVAGKKQDVDGKKKLIEEIIAEEEERLAAPSMVNHQYVVDVPYQAKLIQQITSFPDFKQEYPEVEVSVSDCEVELDGPVHKVEDAWQDLLVDLATTDVDVITFSSCRQEYKELFHDNRMLSAMQKLLQKERVKCVLYMASKQLNVLGVNSNHIQKARELVSDKVSDVVIKVERENLHVLRDDKFKKFILDAEDSYQGILKITIATNNVMIVGMESCVNNASSDISDYLKSNVKVTREVKADVGKVRFVTDQLSADLQRIAMHNGVTVYPRVSKDAFTVEGSVANVEAATKELYHLMQTQISEVTHQESKPGVHQFFNEGQGMYKLHMIEREQACVIEQVKIQEAMDKAGDLWHSKKAAPIEREMRMKAIHRTKEFQEVTACAGDITKQRVDAIVCPSNENLSHFGGLAEAIIKAGGSQLEKECEEYMQSNYPIVGEVVVTNGGKLPCSKVFHAIGPTWRDDVPRTSLRDEDNELATCTNQCLENMVEFGFRSIAIPAISTGNNGFPVDRCTQVITDTIAKFLKKHNNNFIREIRLIGLDAKVSDSFAQALKSQFSSVETFAPEFDSISPDWMGGGDDPEVMPDYEGQVEGHKKIMINAPNDTNIHVLSGRLEEQQADVIVNTMNTSMQLDTGKVSRAIGEKAGSQLQRYLDDQNPNDPSEDLHGKIIVTPGFRLQCRELYHIFCRPFDKNVKGPTVVELRNYIVRILEKCHNSRISSIALPTIGTGGLGFPAKIAAQINLEAIIPLCTKSKLPHLKNIYIVGYSGDPDTIEAFQQQCEKYCDKRKLLYDKEESSSGGAGRGHSGLKFSLVSSSRDKHVINVGNRMEFEASLGDITNENTSAVINATNEALDLSVGNVSTALLRKGGDSIQEELKAIDISRCPGIDETVVTRAGDLPVGHIIHVVYDLSASDVRKCIANCLKTAENHTFRSVAFPMIGTAEGGTREIRGLAHALLDELARFVLLSEPRHLTKVKATIFRNSSHLKLFGEAMSEVENKALSEHLGLRGAAVDQESCNTLYSYATRNKPGVRFKLPALRNPLKKRKAEPKPKAHAPTSVFSLFTKRAEPVIFLIYSSNNSKGDIIKVRIKELIASEFRADTVNDSSFKDMPDNYLRKIYRIGEEHCVEIEVDKSDYMPRVKVTGAQQPRKDALMQIKEVVFEYKEMMAEEQAIVNRCCWYKVTDAEGFTKLPPQLMAKLEKAHEKGKKDSYITVEGSNFQVKFEGDSGTMQKNGTRVIERITRRDPSKELPVHWTLQDVGEHRVVELKHNSKEMLEAQDFFMNTSGAFVSRVVKIERIENPLLYKQYITQKREIEQRPGTHSANELRLFHGTNSNVCSNINARGFNRVFSGRNFGAKYGKGTYFAVESSYSANDTFSPPDSRGYKYMYIVLFLAGESVKGEESMIELPMKDRSNPSAGYYDSAIDDEVNPQVYIAFSDVSAYPQYLITFE